MNQLQPEQFQNPDEQLAYYERQGRKRILLLQPAKADSALKFMTMTAVQLQQEGAKHFTPKDHTTKVEYAPLASEPKPKPNEYEHAIIQVKESSHNRTPELDEELARMLVEQSIDKAYMTNGMQELEEYVKLKERADVR